MLFIQQLFVIYENKQKHKTKLSDVKKWAHDLGLTDVSLHPDSSLTVWPQTDHLTSLNVRFHVSKSRESNTYLQGVVCEDRIRQPLHETWPALHWARRRIPILKRERHCGERQQLNGGGTTVSEKPPFCSHQSNNWFAWNYLWTVKLSKSLHTGHLIITPCSALRWRPGGHHLNQRQHR